MLLKTPDGALIPASSPDSELIAKLSIGKEYGCTLTQLRNGQFHRKVFALLGLMYDQLPRVTAEHKGQQIEQSFDRFRKEAVILAGHYHTDVTGRGELRLEPHSLSYGNCTQEQIERIYSDLIDLALRELSGYKDREDLEEVVNEILRFA